MIGERTEEKTNESNREQMTPLLPVVHNNASGLNFLRTVDTLFVKQQPSLNEAIFGIAFEAKYDIFNDKNERLLQATETSKFLQRFCCATRRGFELRLFDNNNQELILIRRPFKCCSGCSCCAYSKCCSQEVTVESPPGTVIGTVSQLATSCRAVFAIKDEHDNHILTLQAPLIMCDGPVACCCETKYLLLGTDGHTEIGAIYKKYRGFINEVATSADAFLLKIPMDLDVKMKAVALGSLFLIEYLFFSAVPSRN